jgi:hypothetical protein
MVQTRRCSTLSLGNIFPTFSFQTLNPKTTCEPAVMKPLSPEYMQGTPEENTQSTLKFDFCDEQKEEYNHEHQDCAMNTRTRKALRWPAMVPFVKVASMSTQHTEVFLRHYRYDFPQVEFPTCVTES